MTSSVCADALTSLKADGWLDGATVFIDDGFLECLSRVDGTASMLAAGAAIVSRFESLSVQVSNAAPGSSAIFFVSEHVSRSLDDIAVAIGSGKFSSVLVLSGLSEAELSASQRPPLTFAEALEAWEPAKADARSHVKVLIRHFPARASAVVQKPGGDVVGCAGSFVLSGATCHSILPLTLHRLHEFQSQFVGASKLPGSLDDVSADDIPSSIRAGYRHVAYALSDALQAWELDVETHCFALGKTSEFIGNTVSQIAKDRKAERLMHVSGRPLAWRPASLILVDRSLDVVTPLTHADNVLDKFAAVTTVSSSSDDVLSAMTHAARAPCADESPSQWHDIPAVTDELSSPLLYSCAATPQAGNANMTVFRNCAACMCHVLESEGFLDDDLAGRLRFRAGASAQECAEGLKAGLAAATDAGPALTYRHRSLFGLIGAVVAAVDGTSAGSEYATLAQLEALQAQSLVRSLDACLVRCAHTFCRATPRRTWQFPWMTCLHLCCRLWWSCSGQACKALQVRQTRCPDTAPPWQPWWPPPLAVTVSLPLQTQVHAGVRGGLASL